MSGPQGSDPTQAWSGQQPHERSGRWQQRPLPNSATGGAGMGPDAGLPAAAVPRVRAARAARLRTAASGYPQADQYGQQPTAVRPAYRLQSNRAIRSTGQPGLRSADAVRPARSVRPADAVRPACAGRTVSSSPPYGRGSRWRAAKKSMGMIVGIVGGAGRPHPDRRRGVTGLLEARLLRDHQARRQRRSDRCRADPQRRDQRLRRQERQGRQLQQRAEPHGQEGRHLRLRGQHRRHQAQVTVTFQDDNGTYEVGRPK